MTSKPYLKFTGHDRKPLHGVADYPPIGHWSEPREPRLCESGWHALRVEDLAGEFIADELWVVKLDGRIITDEVKVVGERIRFVRRVKAWNERTQRIFACDCAERVLSMYEVRYPGDGRPREAIEVARRYANGEATKAQMAAAWATASAAARATAWAAASATAGAAAWAAGSAAAWAAAWAAASATAGAAASATARAAARDAAWDPARAAARATVWAAEREWQSLHLLELVGLNPDDYARRRRIAERDQRDNEVSR